MRSVALILGVLAIAGSAAAAEPSAAEGVEVVLSNGRVISARSAVRSGDEVVVVLSSGTMRFPASRVKEIRAHTGARDRSGFNILPPATASWRATPTAPAVGTAPPLSALLSELPSDLRAAESWLRQSLVTVPGEARLLVGRKLQRVEFTPDLCQSYFS